MLEIETKHEIKNINVLRRKLRKIGARKKRVKIQKDYYYSPPNETFLGKEKYLRIREIISGKQKSSSFEYHVPRGDFVADEYELGIKNPEILRYILKALKFKLELIIEKNRESWDYGKVKIEIDQVKKLGNYVEIEVMGQGQKKALKIIGEIEKKLGLERKNVKMNYFKLFIKKYRPRDWRKYYSP